jgi:hypothetical protein
MPLFEAAAYLVCFQGIMLIKRQKGGLERMCRKSTIQELQETIGEIR